jgi:hypothetical protein
MKSASLLIVVFMSFAFSQTCYGQAPNIDVSGAASEFISNNETATFVVTGITVQGIVDTMKATVHTSSVRSISEEYTRYKPIADSITFTREGMVTVYLHLDGKLPLPDDSIRGSVRLSVAASMWNGQEWQGAVSEKFSVPIANMPIPKPAILPTSSGKRTAKIRWDSAEVVLFEFRVRPRDGDSVDAMEDIRQILLDTVIVGVKANTVATTNGQPLQLWPALRLIPSKKPTGEWFQVVSSVPPVAPAFRMVQGAIALNIKARSKHRGSKSGWRIFTAEVHVQ